VKHSKLAEQFKAQVKCAKDAGIYDSLFLAFGSLLGYVRCGGPIGHDNDMDVGILSDQITKDQEEKYLNLLNDRGLYRYRRKVEKYPHNGRLFWTSLRMHPKEYGWKCCNWFMWNHKGYTFHAKGVGTFIKGIPSDCFKLGGEGEFLGTKIRIPEKVGKCLDWWYPDWNTPRKGGNSDCIRMNVKDWANKKTWNIKL